MDGLIAGFGAVLQPYNILFCFIVALVGTLIGILPGSLWEFLLDRPIAATVFAITVVVAVLPLSSFISRSLRRLPVADEV